MGRSIFLVSRLSGHVWHISLGAGWNKDSDVAGVCGAIVGTWKRPDWKWKGTNDGEFNAKILVRGDLCLECLREMGKYGP